MTTGYDNAVELSVTSSTRASRRRVTLVGILAVAVPAVMWLEFLVLGLTRPGYNMITDAASQLGASGTPNAEEFTVGFFYVGGALTFLLGLGLLHVSRRWFWRTGAFMTALAGVLLIVTGYFPTAGVSAHVTFMHNAVSQICFAIAALSPLALLAGSVDLRVPVGIRRLWATSSLLALSVEAVALVLRGFMHFPEGIFQRPFLAALTIWFVATGVWLIRRHQPASELVVVRE